MAALRYAQELPGDRLIVVILPDTGARYLSKVYDDKWLRENGFLETTWSEVTLRELLANKQIPTLITVQLTDRITEVIALMKENDISQVPALYEDGTLAGLVTEVDMLKHMLEAGHSHTPEEKVASIVQPASAVFPSSTRLEEVLPSVAEGHVILVTEANKPVGILTKIDILDFIAQAI